MIVGIAFDDDLVAVRMTHDRRAPPAILAVENVSLAGRIGAQID